MIKSSISFWTAKEIAEDEGLISQVENDSTIRQCSYCGLYVSVNDYAGEKEIQDETHYDICDDCIESIENNEEISTKEECSYEDYVVTYTTCLECDSEFESDSLWGSDICPDCEQLED